MPRKFISLDLEDESRKPKEDYEYNPEEFEEEKEEKLKKEGSKSNLFAYHVLRILFVCGYAIKILLTFVPSTRMKVGGFMGFGGEERVLSPYDMIQLLFKEKPGAAMLIVIIFAIMVAFVVLALTYPKRWVFLTGAIFVAFFLLVSFFQPAREGVEYLIIPRVLGLIGEVLCLTGFFVKPPKAHT
ncbi:MAG: hypothetical protein ACE5KE_01680 [Methanosarcinales archaeon]